MKKDDVYYVSRMQEGTKNQLPISEIDIKDVDDIGKRTYVKGNVMPSTGGAPKEDVFDARVVSGGSYREAFNQGAVTDKMDGWSIPKERMDEYERMWSKARKATSKKEADRMRNEVVQGIAADMGVPITVYPSLKEVPKTLKKYGETFVSGAVTADHAGIYVILDRCRNLTAENMASVLRHEAAGHFGLRKLYDSPEAYQADLMQLGEAAFKKKIDYEEKISREAENRETYQAGSEDENLNKVYNLLQNSESNLRNSTVNELRNLHRRRELDYMFRDGYPLPSMYHIEQQRKRMP